MTANQPADSVPLELQEELDKCKRELLCETAGPRNFLSNVC